MIYFNIHTLIAEGKALNYKIQDWLENNNPDFDYTVKFYLGHLQFLELQPMLYKIAEISARIFWLDMESGQVKDRYNRLFGQLGSPILDYLGLTYNKFEGH